MVKQNLIDLANKDQRKCLKIDCTNINQNRSGSYRTKADNPEEQVCYFNEALNEQLYNIFISKRIKSENFEKAIYFIIDRVQSKTDKETFSSNKTLEKNGSSNDRLLKRSREPTSNSADGEEGENRYGKTSKQLLYARELARPKCLSGR